jgi:hypothetical protein
MTTKNDEKKELAELLGDVSFDRKIAPRNESGNLLVSLIKKKAISPETAQPRSNYLINNTELDTLVKAGRVISVANNPPYLYLTDIGALVACGEWTLRKLEKK